MDKKLVRFILLIGVFVSFPLSINAHHGTGISYNLSVPPRHSQGNGHRIQVGESARGGLHRHQERTRSRGALGYRGQ